MKFSMTALFPGQTKLAITCCWQWLKIYEGLDGVSLVQ